MKKYYCWYDNGTGYYDCAGIVEAESHDEAVAQAAASFGPGEMKVWASRRDPNRKQADNTSTARWRKFAAKRRGNVKALTPSVGTKAIKLGAPLPCAVRGCINDAYAALAWQDADDVMTLGLWMIQPFCESCAKAMAQNGAKI